MVKWVKTKDTGVRYWESDTRRFQGKPDRCYVIRYKRGQQTVSETIGWKSGGITPAYCARLRGQIIANIRSGVGFHSFKEKGEIEAAKRKGAESEAVTLFQAFTDFLDTRNLKPSTIREYQRSMNTAFEDWKIRPVIDITRHMVAGRHKKLKRDAQARFVKKCNESGQTPTEKEKNKSGAAQANLHMRFLRALMNFCAGFYEDTKGQPLIKSNPVKRLSETKQWYPVQRRQTIITAHQLPKWFQAVKALEDETVRDYLIFVWLTGCRKTEALSLEVEQVDVQAKTCTFIDPKNNQPLTLPIPGYLLSVIKSRLQKVGGGKHVFPGHKAGRHLVEPRRQIQKVIKASKVRFTLHDLRRLFITTGESLDLSSFALKRLVNHSIGDDTTSGYIVSDPERLRDPMQKIEDRLLRTAKAIEPGKVIQLKKG
ncbi:MAG: tyrosine-type recombinase/integrase [Nitrospinae bacterium]|nr:tyrosine-type recombinase/integrase [Nitrospinota bacterium]